jgi:hypothetical protein
MTQYDFAECLVISNSFLFNKSKNFFIELNCKIKIKQKKRTFSLCTNDFNESVLMNVL